MGGQSSLRPFWRNYFEKTDAIIWVVDASSLNRLRDCREELGKILDEDRLLGAGVLIFVNKIDTIANLEDRRQVVDHIKNVWKIFWGLMHTAVSDRI